MLNIFNIIFTHIRPESVVYNDTNEIYDNNGITEYMMTGDKDKILRNTQETLLHLLIRYPNKMFTKSILLSVNKVWYFIWSKLVFTGIWN